jgi:hypothetical protein
MNFLRGQILLKKPTMAPTSKRPQLRHKYKYSSSSADPSFNSLTKRSMYMEDLMPKNSCFFSLGKTNRKLKTRNIKLQSWGFEHSLKLENNLIYFCNLKEYQVQFLGFRFLFSFAFFSFSFLLATVEYSTLLTDSFRQREADCDQE